MRGENSLQIKIDSCFFRFHVSNFVCVCLRSETKNCEINEKSFVFLRKDLSVAIFVIVFMYCKIHKLLQIALH